jgi:hypothetical protein
VIEDLDLPNPVIIAFYLGLHIDWRGTLVESFASTWFKK